MKQQSEVWNQAIDAACAIYRQRAIELVTYQVNAMKAGLPTQAINLYPPSNDELVVIHEALLQARDAGIHEALGPIIRECNEWTAKGAKARIDAIACEVRAMKSSSVSVAS